MERIYLDHAATTPMDQRIVDKMMPYFTEIFGNPSSIHSYGREARKWLDEAREVIAGELHCKQQEIILTSGGTEADNLAITGVAMARQHEGKHIITTKTEHHAVLHTCERLEKLGFDVTYLDVDHTGLIYLDQLKQALRDDTILVTIMYGNNETGVIQPIKEIGQLLHDHAAHFHTDAVQAFGTISIDVTELHIDLLSASGHKLNGPMGTGFLYVNERVKLSPQLFGGEQERKRRAGTENVAGIIGLAEAVQLTKQNRREKAVHYGKLKEAMLQVFEEESLNFSINGHPKETLPHILNVHFPGVSIESLLVNLDMEGIAVSSGSACTAGSVLPSHVLSAMYGEEAKELTSSVRISFGLGNEEEHVKQAARKIAAVVKRLAK
ncbi:cysteine desulfurase family protein [Bacillus altitudinis]|uniref:cysteine desulfurase family protein n=1 Tax=Bacillus altitudinis TaxID=293387 RepID=UPI00110ED7E4|nr:cysteine desulfurase family protein [Bacillus altitudinis]MDI6647841.1 cysteine desulfurase family protein [Bacillus altitudinis]MDI6662465.1 cysteine desulfurase family protein [Bacillus altitudinis]WOI40039.1 cysteine desulfurase family protein [Bacillus altitudinis]